MTQPILIAGGGIAGLAAGLALARIGRPAAVYEQAAAFEEVGAGLQMSPNAVRALQHLGAWEAVAPACVTPDEIHVRDGQTGQLLQRVRLGRAFEERFGAPYRVVHRADILAGLVMAARAQPAIGLETGRRVSGARDDAAGAALDFADGAARAGAAVIAADGIRSTLRASVFDDPAVVDQGHVLYRALVPLGRVPAGIAADAVTLWLLPGAHVVHYPVSNWRQFNIVVSVEDTWQGEGWSAAGDAATLRRRLAGVAEALGDVLAAPTSWLKWRGADRNPRETWSRGHIALLGDAAHATLPYLAQGAAMSLEDACELARCLEAAADVPSALTAYGAARRARTARIQMQSREQGRIYHLGGASRVARNAALRLMPQGVFLGRLKWIYDWAP